MAPQFQVARLIQALVNSAPANADVHVEINQNPQNLEPHIEIQQVNRAQQQQQQQQQTSAATGLNNSGSPEQGLTHYTQYK